ncbi:ABC transporter ATP-binding protein [Streptantibioticus parmotrematis]|uniref:ABC transporter ATP-binding protein n=1 Tax=Streptantibioticus parmotrematis TaxID=2873249 RepID=UPI0027DF12FD|nr:ABC transporter ATP-binding protein [Streptantibioticus parmotrematis]
MNDSTSRSGPGDGPALEARGLGKKYRRGWALRNCSFRLPAGRICGLVGPNGAGKSTLLGITANLLEPTAGTLRVFGAPPESAEANHRTAFLAQDKPLFRRLTVEETLRLGRELNPGWDQAAAEDIVRAGNIPLTAKVGTLSGGQRTRVAFAVAFGKRPDLLLLDEPMSDLDPLVRRELMGVLMAEVAERGTTVLISSHLLSELENVCDYLFVVSSGGLRLAGEVGALRAAHSVLTVAGNDEAARSELSCHTVVESHTDGYRLTALVRPHGTLTAPGGPLAEGWEAASPNLEELVLAYLRSPEAPPLLTRSAQVPGAHDTTAVAA